MGPGLLKSTWNCKNFDIQRYQDPEKSTSPVSAILNPNFAEISLKFRWNFAKVSWNFVLLEVNPKEQRYQLLHLRLDSFLLVK